MYIVGQGYSLGRSNHDPYLPYALASGRGPVLWCKIDHPDYYSLNAGSENDLRYIDSVLNRSLISTPIAWAGSTLAQGGATTLKPVAASYPEGRAMFFDGGNDVFISSLVASAFSGWHGATGTAIDIMLPVKWLGAFTEVLLDTLGPIAATNRGLLFAINANGGIQLRLGDASGTFLVNENSGSGFVTANVTSILHLVITDSSYLVEVDGVTALSGAHAGGGAATAPNKTLHMGNHSPATNPFGGYLPEIIIYDQVLSDAEVAGLEEYLGLWKLSVSWADLLNYANALWQLKLIAASNGSAWVDLLGNYPITEVNAPTHGTSASFGGKNVMTLDGVDQFAHFDALAALVTGDDLPMYMNIGVELDDVVSAYMLGSFGGLANANYAGMLTSPVSLQARRQAPLVALTAGAVAAAAMQAGYSFRGQTGSVYLNGVRNPEQGAHDADALSLDAAATGARRYNSTADLLAPGDFAYDIRGIQALNAGDHGIIDQAAAGNFGL